MEGNYEVFSCENKKKWETLSFKVLVCSVGTFLCSLQMQGLDYPNVHVSSKFYLPLSKASHLPALTSKMYV